jgi:hypothetical protein
VNPETGGRVTLAVDATIVEVTLQARRVRVGPTRELREIRKFQKVEEAPARL